MTCRCYQLRLDVHVIFISKVKYHILVKSMVRSNSYYTSQLFFMLCIVVMKDNLHYYMI